MSSLACFHPSPAVEHHRRPSYRRISASLSDRPSTTSPPSSTPNPRLPIRNVPGEYGLPLIGPIRDRLDYFYFQGRDAFFKTRIENLKSTVIRLNMPPGPFISPNPRVVALLDAASFPVLFDVSKVEKKDLFSGTYMPSTDLTGGYRILSYLDPSEPKHAVLKKLLFNMLGSRRQFVIPEFRSSFGSMLDKIEAEIEKQKAAVDFGSFNEQASFDFLAKSIFNTDPASTPLGSDAPGLIVKWVLFQLGPILTLGLPFFIEDPLLHTFALPSFLVKSDYQRLYDFFYKSATSVLEEAEKMGISKEEACHNILFAICFNSYGGMKIFFPSIIKWIGSCGPDVHKRLATEIRAAVRKNGGEVTMKAIEGMPLVKSVVYETFRIEPPVPFQYGKAKEDMVVNSHDAAYQVRKGEMLFGYQPFATKDGKVFAAPEEFVPDRFVGEGEKLIKHVLWSNGFETESPTVDNKQCAGKDFVVLMSRLLVVEFFLRYDTIKLEVGSSVLGSTVKVGSLKKATF